MRVRGGKYPLFTLTVKTVAVSVITQIKENGQDSRRNGCFIHHVSVRAFAIYVLKLLKHCKINRIGDTDVDLFLFVFIPGACSISLFL